MAICMNKKVNIENMQDVNFSYSLDVSQINNIFLMQTMSYVLSVRAFKVCYVPVENKF